MADKAIITYIRVSLGWRARTSLQDGIRLAYQAYLNESKQAVE